MTEEIIMFNKSDVESIEESIKRLEQENNANLKQIGLDVEHICNLNKRIDELEQENKQMKSALEEIRILATKNVSIENFVKIQNRINEVIG